MSKRMSAPVLFLLALVFSLTLADVLALAAQDPQTQPTTPQPQTQPAKTTKRKRTQVKKETTTGDQTAPAEPAAATEPTTPAQTATPAQTMTPAQTTTTMTPTEQTDLSGTYAGTFNCDALGLTGDTTLTINGNQFSTADGKTGRIVASTTHGYTAVAMQTGDVSTTPATGAAAATPAAAPMIVSMRAHKSRNRLTLTSVPGATMPCSFGPTRAVARTRRSRQTTPAATGTEVSMPTPAAPATQPAQPTTETPTTPTTPIPSQTPSPEPSPTPMPTPHPSPTPSGTPAPEPAPTASPSPTPSPTPSPKPARPRG